MKKILILIVSMLMFSTMWVSAQDTSQDNKTDGGFIAVDTGRQILRELTVNTFDDPTVWNVIIPSDKGYIDKRRMAGSPPKSDADGDVSPADANPVAYNPAINYVLGVKAGFYARSYIDIEVKAVDEIFLPGIVKVLSVWVAGRGRNHELSAVLIGLDGNVFTLPFGKLSFTGWKKIEVSIPPDLAQEDPSGTVHGLFFKKFIISTDFEQTVSKYYIYFDDMQIISDLMDDALQSEDRNDMSDGW